MDRFCNFALHEDYAVLDRSVYAVKGVVAIPLTESAATASLNSLAARGPQYGTSPGRGNTPTSDLSDVASDDEYPSLLSGPSPKRGQPTVIIPPPASEPVSDALPDVLLNPDPVVASTTSPGRSAGKTIVDRLSFWKFRSKPKLPALVPDSVAVVPSVPPILSVIETPPTPDVPKTPPFLELLDELPEDREDPHGESLREGHEDHKVPVPNNPRTSVEKSTELEAKIINQCIRLFSHEMYFAYDFGAWRLSQFRGVNLPLNHGSEQISLHQYNANIRNSWMRVDIISCCTPLPTLRNRLVVGPSPSLARIFLCGEELTVDFGGMRKWCLISWKRGLVPSFRSFYTYSVFG